MNAGLPTRDKCAPVSSAPASALNLHAVEGKPGEQPLLLLHGVGRNHRTFLELSGLLGSFWNPWMVDLRGHGASPWSDESYRVIDYTTDILKWLEGRWDKPAVVYGHSLGAMVAASVAAEAPDLVAGLILEEPPFHTMGERIRCTFWEHFFQGLATLLQQPRSFDSLLQGLREMQVPDRDRAGLVPLSSLRDEQSLRFSAECLLQVDAKVFERLPSGRWLEGYDLDSVYRRLRCPTYLLQGNPDLGGALSDADAQALERNVECLVRVRFPTLGHQIHWPKAERVLPVFYRLEKHLNTCPESSAL